MRELKETVARARLLVVGDVMLDRYWFGDVERISPEAPVPVVRVDKIEERPGGAANVARNCASLGAQVSLLSVVGADEAGSRLEALIRAEGAQAVLHRDDGLHTTVKLRVISRNQQLIRIDFEREPSHEVLEHKLQDFQRLAEASDVVILSDYGKGGLTHIRKMLEIARSLGKPVLVDPKGEDYDRYAGATVLTPNRAELRQVVGSWRNETELAQKAQGLRERLGLEALLLTRSEEGMTLFRQSGIVHESAQAMEVFDVSGAGDTVIATLGTMLAAGRDMVAGMRLANRAAGIVVGKLGTAVVDQEELFA